MECQNWRRKGKKIEITEVEFFTKTSGDSLKLSWTEDLHKPGWHNRY